MSFIFMIPNNSHVPPARSSLCYSVSQFDATGSTTAPSAIAINSIIEAVPQQNIEILRSNRNRKMVNKFYRAISSQKASTRRFRPWRRIMAPYNNGHIIKG
jgi:hypothetical protein